MTANSPIARSRLTGRRPWGGVFLSRHSGRQKRRQSLKKIEVAVAELDGTAQAPESQIGLPEQGLAAGQVVVENGLFRADVHELLVDLYALLDSAGSSIEVAKLDQEIDVLGVLLDVSRVEIDLELLSKAQSDVSLELYFSGIPVMEHLSWTGFGRRVSGAVAS